MFHNVEKQLEEFKEKVDDATKEEVNKALQEAKARTKTRRAKVEEILEKAKEKVTRIKTVIGAVKKDT